MIRGFDMHVCIISGYKTSAGGLENFVSELSNFLIKHNVRVTIFNIFHKDLEEIGQHYWMKMIRPYNILPPRFRFALYEDYAYSLKVWRKIRFSNYFDIIHGNSGFCFFQALFRDRTPFIMTFHGLRKGFHYKVYGPNSRILKCPRYYTLFYSEEFAAKKCDLAIAPSKSVRDELLSIYKVNPAKVKVIYNGVNTDHFRPINRNFSREFLGLPKNKNYVIWVGNNPRLKGLQIATKAVKGLKNVYLLVVGVSGTNFENVIFWGEVQNRELLLILYNAANVLVFPTLYEGFPLVPLEAMACGLPIIISEECPTKEIIRNGVEGFIVKREPNFFKEKIKTLLENDKLYREILQFKFVLY
ncbi:MAG: glycosyltransferase family 4 protein [Candidatus Micrarchaeia archaeon]